MALLKRKGIMWFKSKKIIPSSHSKRLPAPAPTWQFPELLGLDVFGKPPYLSFMSSHQGIFTFSKQGQHKCCGSDTKTSFLPFKWQMIKRIQARIFCLAQGLKVLNLCILFLLLSQIGLVTRQLKYLISFANSYILIEAASLHDRCCQYKHSPDSSLVGQ